LPELNPPAPTPLTIHNLQALYQQRQLTPLQLMERLLPRLQAQEDNPIWISRYSNAELLAAARALQQRPDRDQLPLYGIPFAVKDNIDVAGLPTTAACPALHYVPAASSPVVEALLQAGALLIGKTNMDQLATGLVGTRSPYGICCNRFHPDYIAGGSSSGSGLAVGLGLVAFALGTDTAGSGRVPAALNNIVGYKPTRGIFSTRGLVPACRHLDCLSIFANRTADIATLLPFCSEFDAQDDYARPFAPPSTPVKPLANCHIGVLADPQQEFFGDDDARHCYRASLQKLQRTGARLEPFDFTPFRDAATLLYEGAFLAERSAGLQHFPAVQDTDLLPVIRELMIRGRNYSAVDLFHHQHRLQHLRAQIAPLWRQFDALFLPTHGPVYRLDEIQDNPLQLNRNLGYYTNFVNLLDLSTLALPAGMRACGIPFGITLVAPAFQDLSLLAWARTWESLQIAQG
jgi:allophanate hydrolase